MKKRVLTRHASTLGLVTALCIGCGTRKEEDLETRRQQESRPVQQTGDLVLTGEGNSSADAVATSESCEVELKRSTEFDPKDSQNPVTVYFRGKVEPSCVEKGAKPEVHIHTLEKITVPGATCSPSEGDFNLICEGDIVNARADGNISINFKGHDDREPLSNLRVKVSYSQK